jgi:hypothetical protein
MSLQKEIEDYRFSMVNELFEEIKTAYIKGICRGQTETYVFSGDLSGQVINMLQSRMTELPGAQVRYRSQTRPQGSDACLVLRIV